ncbi:hypothetical protein ABK040_003683 [Willaertia magna]
MSKPTPFKKYKDGLKNINFITKKTSNYGFYSAINSEPFSSSVTPQYETTPSSSQNTDAYYYNTYHLNNYHYQGGATRYQPHHHSPNAPNPYYDEEAFYLQQEQGGEYTTSNNNNNNEVDFNKQQESDYARKKLQFIGSRFYRKSSTSATRTNKIQRDNINNTKRSFHTNVTFSTNNTPSSMNLLKVFKIDEIKNVIVEYDDEYERKLAVITGPETLDENNTKWNLIDIYGENKVINSSQLTYQFTIDSERGFNIEDIKQMQQESNKLISSISSEEYEKMWKIFLQRKSVKITIKEAAEYLFQSSCSTALYSAYRVLYKNALYFKHTSNLNFECRSLREVEELKQMGSEEKENILYDKIFLLKIINRLIITNEERSLFYKQLKNNIMKEIKAMRPEIEFTKESMELNENEDSERIKLFRSYALGMYNNLDTKKKIYEAYFKPLGADDHLQAFRVARDLQLFKTQNIHLLRSMEEEMPHVRDASKFKQTIKELKESILSSPDPDKMIRRDLRHLTVYTLDDYPLTTEIDDGVSIETINNDVYIYVHIADVSRYITPGTLLDKEAQRRVSSVYLPECKLSMIPAELSEDILSLSPDKENYTLTFRCKFNEDGSIADWDIFPAITGKIVKLDYVEADQILEQSTSSDVKTYESLKTMLDIANKRFRFRLKRGANPPPITPKPKVKVTEEEKIIEVDTTLEEQASASRRLVAEFMIAANEIGGFYAAKHDIAVPYRGTRTTASGIITSEEEIDTLLNLNVHMSDKELANLMLKGSNGSLPGGYCINQSPKFHQGIGTANYVQVTSPIRRYSDLLVHHQLKAQMRGEEPPYKWDDLQEVLFAIEPISRAITSLQKKSERFWLLKYFEHHLTKQSGKNNKYRALVLDSKRNSTSFDNDMPYLSFLYLLDTAFRTTVKSNNKHAQGEFVNVRVASVSPYNDEISFEEIETNTSSSLDK